MFNPEDDLINNTFGAFDDSNLDDLDSYITLFTQRNGRRVTTNAVGIKMNKDELKTHLKELKRTNGCNGTIKTISYDGKEQIALQLQGDKMDIIQTYLTDTMNINKENITVKE
uniref:SUI1 domain-containing protein n=1 Tax=Megaviridae environmental sample TaxID=1737588 RepID=A0A5J6VLG0_9VIRU|nr:MAG: hypothetical protein [Megaviridae environmental sample]